MLQVLSLVSRTQWDIRYGTWAGKYLVRFTSCNIFIFFEGEAKVLSSSSDDSPSEEDTYGIGVHDGKFPG